MLVLCYILVNFNLSMLNCGINALKQRTVQQNRCLRVNVLQLS